MSTPTPETQTTETPAKAPNPKALKDLPVKTLVNIYNEYADKPRKGFKDQEAAVQAVKDLFKEKKLKAEFKKGEVSVTETKRRGRTTGLTTSIIKVTGKTAKVRPNTNIATLFAELMKCDGKTVGEYYALVNENDAMPDKATSKTINLALHHEIITVKEVPAPAE